MTTLTITSLLIVVLGVFGRGGYGRALALGGATAAGSAVVVGGTAVPTFYAVALGAPVGLVMWTLRRRGATKLEREPYPPGVLLLVLFLCWCTLVTLLAPILFPGLPVLQPGPVPDLLVPGEFLPSNGAQVIYLLLSVSVVMLLARSPRTTPSIMGLLVAAPVLLSFWRYVSQQVGLPFPENFFDNSPSFNYIETAAGGLQRFRGILSEPAGLAVACLVCITYMLPRAAQVRGGRRIGALALVAMAAVLGFVSTSATFIVAGTIVAGLALGSVLLGFVLRGVRLSALTTVLACVLVVISLYVLPLVADFVEQIVDAKVSSSSYDQRSGTDDNAYQVLFNTYGLGAGVGSNRAASFVPGILCASGVIGFVLFTVAVGLLVARGSRVAEYRPVVWSLVTLLVVKIVSGPDLSDSSGALWVGLGLLSHAALIDRRGPQGTEARAPTRGEPAWTT